MSKDEVSGAGPASSADMSDPVIIRVRFCNKDDFDVVWVEGQRVRDLKEFVKAKYPDLEANYIWDEAKFVFMSNIADEPPSVDGLKKVNNPEVINGLTLCLLDGGKRMSYYSSSSGKGPVLPGDGSKLILHGDEDADHGVYIYAPLTAAAKEAMAQAERVKKAEDAAVADAEAAVQKAKQTEADAEAAVQEAKQAVQEAKQAVQEAKQAEADAKAKMDDAAPDQRDLLQARFETASADVFLAEARHAVAKAVLDEATAQHNEAAADRALTIAQMNKDEGATCAAQKNKEDAAAAAEKAQRDLKEARAVVELRSNKVLACIKVIAAVMALKEHTSGSEEYAKAKEELRDAQKEVVKVSDDIKELLGTFQRLNIRETEVTIKVKEAVATEKLANAESMLEKDQSQSLQVTKEPEFYEKANIKQVSVEEVLGPVLDGAVVPDIPESLRAMLAAIPRRWLETDREFDNIDALRKHLKLDLNEAKFDDLAEVKLVSKAGKMIIAKGTQSIIKEVVEQLGLEDGCVIKFLDKHSNRGSERFAPDFCAINPQAAHAYASLIISVGDAKAVGGGFSPGNKGQVLNYLRACLHEQPFRAFIIGWLSDGREIQFFVASRAASTGAFSYKESQRISLLGGPASSGAAGGGAAAPPPSAPGSLPMVQSLSGLQLLLLLMKASLETHSFTIPKACTRLLGKGGSACVYELPADRAAKVHFSHEGWVSPLKETEAKFLANHFPTILSSASESLAIQEVDGAVHHQKPADVPPAVSLVSNFSNCLVLSPVCQRVSRASFHKGGYSLQIVLDVVNVLRWLHIAGWVHHDVRRSNILMKDGRGVLIDFAFVEKYDDVQSLNSAVQQELTRLMLVIRYWCTGAHIIVDKTHEYDSLRRIVQMHTPEWLDPLAIALTCDFIDEGAEGTFKPTNAYSEFIAALVHLLPSKKTSLYGPYVDQILASRSPDSGTVKANRDRRK